MIHLGQPLIGLTLVQTLLKPFDPPMSPGTFVVFSKFHLNTSNSPNIKVV
jgi:hypothetical protein